MSKLKSIEDYVVNGRLDLERFEKEKEDIMMYRYSLVIVNPDYDTSTDIMSIAKEQGLDYVLEMIDGKTHVFHWTKDAKSIIENGFKVREGEVDNTSFGEGLYFFNFNVANLPWGKDTELIVGDYEGFYFRCVMALVDGTEESYCFLPFNISDITWDMYKPEKDNSGVTGRYLLTYIFNYEFEPSESNNKAILDLQTKIRLAKTLTEEEFEDLQENAYVMYSDATNKVLSHEAVAFADLIILYNSLTQETFHEFLVRSVSLWVALEEECPKDFNKKLKDLLFHYMQTVFKYMNIYNFVPPEILYSAYGDKPLELDEDDSISSTHKLQ